MKAWVVLFFVLFAGSAAALPVRVLSWNLGLLRVLGCDLVPDVGSREARLPSVIADLAAARSVDVLVLQEVWETQAARSLTESLQSAGYQVVHPEVSSWLGLSSGLLLAVRAPLEVQHWSFTPLEQNLGWEGWAKKGLLWAHLSSSTDDTQLELVAVHLGAVRLERGEPTDPREVAVYRSQVEQLAQLVSEHPGPGLLVGDANVGPGEGQQLFDLVAAVATGEVGPEPGGPAPITWDPLNPLVARGLFPHEPPSWIDHILLLGGPWEESSRITLEVLRPGNPTESLSDHDAVLGEVQLAVNP